LRRSSAASSAAGAAVACPSSGGWKTPNGVSPDAIIIDNSDTSHLQTYNGWTKLNDCCGSTARTLGVALSQPGERYRSTGWRKRV